MAEIIEANRQNAIIRQEPPTVQAYDDMRKFGMMISVLSLVVFLAYSKDSSNANEPIGNSPKTIPGQSNEYDG